MRYFAIRNFERFQHYKDRKPQWIKLYRDLWGDQRFFRLKPDSKLFLIGLFTVASCTANRIPEDPEWIAQELRLSPKMMDFGPLLESGFLMDCSSVEQVATQPWPSRYIPDALRSEVLERDNHRCCGCGVEDNLEIDHIIPVSRLPAEWTPKLDDLQTLCRACNRRKRTTVSAEQVATQNILDAERSAPRSTLLYSSSDSVSDSNSEVLENKTPAKRKVTSEWPADLQLTDKMRQYALNRKIDPDTEFEAWRNDCLAHGRVYRDWFAAWRTRIDNVPKFHRAPSLFSNGTRAVPMTRHEKTMDTIREMVADAEAREGKNGAQQGPEANGNAGSGVAELEPGPRDVSTLRKVS